LGDRTGPLMRQKLGFVERCKLLLLVRKKLSVFRCEFHAARTVAHFFDLTVAIYSAFFMVPLLFVNKEFGRHFE
jgi:hypothetical protein